MTSSDRAPREFPKAAMRLLWFTAALLVLYPLSYGPAWSIEARWNLPFNLLRFYSPLPQKYQTAYLHLWMKLDRRVEALVLTG